MAKTMELPHSCCLTFLWRIVLILLAINTSTAQCAAPNIVFILADDLGWNDIGFNNPDIISPHIDGLARSGVILNQSYVQPVCSPSRAALMTGVYPFRLGLQHMVIIQGQAVCASRDRPFLPELLKEGGYATHALGKWHLGYCNRNCTPTYRGFDSFFGFYNGAEDYYTKEFAGGFDFRDNEKADNTYVGTYSSYQYSERIRKIITSHDNKKPLFLYLSYPNVHKPLQAPQKYLDMYPDVTDPNRRALSAMVTAMDDSVGVLINSLKMKGIDDNTLIVFSADNGGMPTYGNNFPLRGGKITVFEGGTRAAALVHGPMFKTTGIRYDGLMHAVDWFPTLVEAAGIKYHGKDQDGVSQWKPIVHQTLPSNRQEVVYNIDDSFRPTQGKAAIRVGDYKLIDGFPGVFPEWYEPGKYHDRWGHISGREDEKSMKWMRESQPDERFKFLFNLKDDPYEHVNLYDQYPAIVKQLESRLQEHRKRYITPYFPLPDMKSHPKNYGGVWSPGWC